MVSVAVGTEKVGEIGSTSPLLGAIADLREQICRLFEEQKALLQNREAEATPAPPSAPVARVMTSPPQPVAVVAEPESPSPPRAPSPRPVEVPPPAEAVPTAPADAGSGPGGRSEDPRQRLDALAKLLDKRLKPAPVPPDRVGDS
jgi:hypothetical protein